MSFEKTARVLEARAVLTALNFDNARSNERSALVLLALLDLTPGRAWSTSAAAAHRIVDIMQWLRDHYDKDYAPNSREMIRRQTLHQFVDAGLVALNPDDPNRAVNSANNCYQITPEALELLRRRDDPSFDGLVRTYRKAAPGQRAAYAEARCAGTWRTSPGRRRCGVPTTRTTSFTSTASGSWVPTPERVARRSHEPRPRRAGSRRARTSAGH